MQPHTAWGGFWKVSEPSPGAEAFCTGQPGHGAAACPLRLNVGVWRNGTAQRAATQEHVRTHDPGLGLQSLSSFLEG